LKIDDPIGEKYIVERQKTCELATRNARREGYLCSPDQLTNAGGRPILFRWQLQSNVAGQVMVGCETRFVRI